MDKPIEWSPDKNNILQKERSVSFEDVAAAIDSGDMLDNTKHCNAQRYPNQWIFTVTIRGYTYEVPYVEDNDKIFLKTIIPSRKAHKKYLNKRRKYEQNT